MAKTKALISCAVTAQLICVFVFAYANCWFSHAKAQIQYYSWVSKSYQAGHNLTLPCALMTDFLIRIYEPVREKNNNLGSDQVRHKPGCTVTEDDYSLEILDLESRGILLSV